MTTVGQKLRESHAILDRAADELEFGRGFCAFSGGHDSLVASHVAMNHGIGEAVAHIDTGIGVPATRKFVRRICVEMEWPALEYGARDYVRGDGEPDPQVYEEFVLRRGFPGPGHHWKMYQRLKERPLIELCRDFRTERGQSQLLVSGRRQHESGRRMAGMDDPVDPKPSKTFSWVQPLFSWREEHIRQYMDDQDLPRNPVVQKCHGSKECLCGAFAQEGELAEIATVAPDVEEEIAQLNVDTVS